VFEAYTFGNCFFVVLCLCVHVRVLVGVWFGCGAKTGRGKEWSVSVCGRLGLSSFRVT
jgi:hypothetical protein